MRQSPSANFLQDRRGVPTPHHRLKRANQTPIPAESLYALTRPPGVVEVTRGTVHLRFVDPAATVTTEVSDPPPPPGNKPVVTVRPRPDRAPEVEVAGGKAIVRVQGWEGIDHAQ